MFTETRTSKGQKLQFSSNPLEGRAKAWGGTYRRRAGRSRRGAGLSRCTSEGGHKGEVEARGRADEGWR